jgi:hypothetical protein
MIQRLATLTSLVALGLLSGCGPGASSHGPRPFTIPGSTILGVPMTYVRPSTYTHGIAPLYDAESVVVRPTHSRPKGRLFLFLGGTKTIPRLYKYIVAVAARHGFNAIALEYPDVPRITNLCASSKDPKCWGNARNEVFTGQNTSPMPPVNKTNSIQQRLIDLLTYLARTDPKNGWSTFLNRGEPQWQLIEVGGHSQGGGHAAYISKFRRLAGYCPIEAPIDGNEFIPTAEWLSVRGQTSPKAGYGFANEHDNFISFGTMVLDWTTLGFAGPQINVDNVKPPYFNSHQLFTSKQLWIALNSHDYTVMDYITPLDSNGYPVFAPVWSYVCRFGA